MIGDEPFTGKDIESWLIARGARRVQSGGSPSFEVAPGQFVRVNHGTTKTPAAKRIAAATGLSYAELRAEMGHPIVAGHRPRRGLSKPVAAGFTKRDVTARVAELRRMLSEVDALVKPGIRDAAFYRDAHERLAAAVRQVGPITDKGRSR